MAQSFRTAISFDGLASASSQALAIKVDGDSQNRVLVDAGGKITWGAGGSSAGDTTLYRSAANTLKTDDAFTAASLAVTGEFTLPTSDGSNNQVLVTNGSGTVSWANQSGGSGSPSGSDGQVQYNNGGSFGGASALHYDDANDRLGIGTTSPTYTLDVEDGTAAIVSINDSGGTLGAATNSRVIFESGGSTAGQVGFLNTGGGILSLQNEDGQIYVTTTSADDIIFRPNATERMRINSSGNVGIGTTSPSTPLHVNGDVTIGDTLILTGDSVSHLSNNTSSGREILQLRAKTTTSDGAGINLYGSGDSSNAGKIIFFSSGSVSLTLDASGNIASTGDFTLDGDIFGTSNTNFFVGNDSNERILFQESSNQIFFYVNGSYRCYVTSGGDFVPYADSTYDLGSTTLRWAEVHADRYYVNDTDSYVEFEADGGSGIDGPGIRFVINGSEMFKVARENDVSTDTMLLLGENNDGIRYRKDDETFHVVIGTGDRLVVANTTTSIYGSADILQLHTTASGDQSGYIGFYNNSATRYGYMGYPSNDDMYFKNENSGGQMYNFSPGSYIYWHVAGAYELRLSSSSLRPYSNEGLNLGESGAAWNHFYLGQGNQFSSGGYWTLRSRDSDRQVMEYVSSERFKKDIEDLPLSEAYQILDARVIKFRGIDDDSSVPLEAGLSAESLHNAGFEFAVRYDEGHWGTTPRAVYYEMLTAPLIKICKDQKDRIESLEARVAALEA